MAFFEFIGDSLRGAAKKVQEGTEAALRSSEKVLRIQNLKIKVEEQREEKDKAMQELARAVFKRYTENKIEDPEILGICQKIKGLKWQIDETWTEIHHLESLKDDSDSNSQQDYEA